MLKKLVTAGILGLMLIPVQLPVETANASEAIFKKMSGKWRGKGLVKAAANAKEESIRCRMSNSISNRPGRLDLTGSCAVSGFVFSLNGFIQQNGSKNSYTASMFRSLANLKQSNFSGARSGTRINFNFKAFDQISKQNVQAKIRLNSRSANAFDIEISRTDPKSGKVFNVGTISFAKR